MCILYEDQPDHAGGKEIADESSSFPLFPVVPTPLRENTSSTRHPVRLRNIRFAPQSRRGSLNNGASADQAVVVGRIL